jgi:hypothetical protein
MHDHTSQLAKLSGDYQINTGCQIKIVKRADAADFYVLPQRWVVGGVIAWLAVAKGLPNTSKIPITPPSPSSASPSSGPCFSDPHGLIHKFQLSERTLELSRQREH